MEIFEEHENQDVMGAPSQRQGARRRNRHRKRRKLPTSVLPSLLTLAGMCCGLTGIHMALENDLAGAIVAILLAVFFDGIDGKVARRLGRASRFGAELDSLSDTATFGISPAVIVYIFSLHSLGRMGWWVSLLFALCMSLRLARFNTYSIEHSNPEWMAGFATGVPAPAGAYILLMPLMLHQLTGWLPPAWFYALWTLAASGLLISRLPTFLMNVFNFSTSLNKAIVFLVGSLVVFGIAYTQPWMTLLALGCVYLGLLPVSIRKAYQRRQQMQHVSPKSVKH